MMGKSPLWITAEEGAQIIDEIIGEKKDILVSTPIQKKQYTDVHLLFIDRCTGCHTINRILKQDKGRVAGNRASHAQKCA